MFKTSNAIFKAAGFSALILFAFFACKNEPKPVPASLQQIQQDPELVKLNALLQKDPNNDSLLYHRAMVYYKLEAFDEAIADAEQAIKRDSMQAPYYQLLADVYMDYARPHDSRRGIDVLKMAAQKFPNDIKTLLKLSEFQLIVKQHGDALSTLNQILLRDPQNAEAYFMSGRVALDKGDTTNAIAALRKSVQFDSGNGDAWMFLGRIFAQKNNPLAIQYFDNALRVDSTNVQAREFKAVFYKRRGDFDKAFQVYRGIIAQNPDYSNAYFDMGMIYLELDSLPKAYTNFDIAIKTDPLFVNAYYYRGITSEKQGNVTAAMSDYTQASKMSPEFEEAKVAKERLEKAQK